MAALSPIEPHMRALVIVPTFNERENLPRLIPQLLALTNVQVLVVDDASPDGTGAIADTLAGQSEGRMTVLHRSGRRGLGRAYVDGIQHALRMDTDVICQMDADLSHQPAALPELLAAIRHAHVVIGSRYVPGGRIVNWPLRRRVLSACANRYIRAICSFAPRDCTSGFRCWRRETLAALPLGEIESEGYSFLVELLWQAVKTGAVIAEVPIEFVERRHGASKLRLRVLVESALAPWMLALRPRRVPNRDTSHRPAYHPHKG